jgi:hypothetical protein
MTIYTDENKHCYLRNDGTMTAVETNIFDGKCAEYIEGQCYESGENFETTYPWKPYPELEAAQAQYERMMAEAEAAYREGVNSVD